MFKHESLPEQYHLTQLVNSPKTMKSSLMPCPLGNKIQLDGADEYTH